MQDNLNCEVCALEPINNHKKICRNCDRELELVALLRSDAAALSVEKPGQHNWQRIKQHIPLKKKTKRQTTITWIFSGAIAASLGGLLFWQHWSMQQELEKVLVLNTILEQQLASSTKPYYQQVVMLNKLTELDKLLLKSPSNQQKLIILQKRNQIMEQQLKRLQGEQHVFDI